MGGLETASRHGIFLVDFLLGEIRLRIEFFRDCFWLRFAKGVVVVVVVGQ